MNIIKLPYSFKQFLYALIAAIGVISSLITVYFVFAPPESINIKYEVMSNNNVFEVKEELGQLDILYNGNSIKRTNENLRIINLKIVNEGPGDVLMSHYDQNDPLGISLTDGVIIEKPEIVTTSNEYIKKNLNLTQLDNNSIIFSPVIFEKNEYFILKFLVLHNNGNVPKIVPRGKIARDKSLNLIDSSHTTSQKSIITEIVGGGLLIQLGKFIVYFVGTLAILIAIIYIWSLIDNLITKQKREKLIKEYKQLNGLTNKSPEYYQYYFDVYLNKGKNQLERLLKYLTKFYITTKKLPANKDQEIFDYHNNKMRTNNRFLDINPQTLKQFKIINNQKKNLELNQTAYDSLKRFSRYINKKDKNYELVYYSETHLIPN